jgi:hypothetical protein
MKKTPFGRIKKKLIPVFPHTEGGQVYLVSTGYPDPNIYPEEIQETERSAGMVQYLLNVAAMRLSDKIGCTPMEAKRRLAPQVREFKYDKYLSGTELDSLKSLLSKAATELSAQQGISSDEARSRLGDPLMQDTEIVYDYTMHLDEHEMSKLFSAFPSAGQQDKESRLGVSLVMRYRVAKRALVAVSGTEIDAWFDVNENDKFKWNNQTLIVQNYDANTGAIAFKGFGAILTSGDELFLLTSSGEYACGDDDWTEDDTLALKAIACPDGATAFEKVYEFFRNEIAGRPQKGAKGLTPVATEETDLGKSSSSLPNTLPPAQSTGEISTGV